MTENTEAIKQDIESTRDAMAEKMGAIESKIKGTVEQVKDSVEGTVEQVKQAFDFKQQVAERPWTMLGGSLIAGYVLGSLGGGESSASDSSSYRKTYQYDYKPGQPQQYYSTEASSSSNAPAQTSNYAQNYSSQGAKSSSSGMLGGLADQFGDEFEVIKGAAITTLTNLLRDVVSQNLPQFSQQYERMRSDQNLDQKLQDRVAPSSSPSSSTPLGGSSTPLGGSSTVNTGATRSVGIDATPGLGSDGNQSNGI